MRRYSPFIVSAAAVVLFYAVILTVYFTCVHTPKAETAPDNVGEVTEEFDADAQREAYLSAVEKAGSMSFRQYSEKMTSLVTYPDHQDSDSFSGSFKEINRGKDDPRYYASVTHGEDTFECWYLGGTGYSDESGEKLKSPAEEGDFAEYIDGRVFLALGEDFYTLDAVKNDDGTCSVTFDGLSRVPDEVSRMYYDMGMTGVKISGFSGKAEIDDKGRMSDQSIVLKLSMTRAGENVTAEYRSEISFENPGQKFTISPPDDAEYREIGSIFAPMMIGRAYENFLWHSYSASYETDFRCEDADSETAYSVSMSYSVDADQKSGFEAKDKTVIKYDLRKNDSTVTRTTAFAGGEYTTDTDGDTTSRTVTEDAARSTYYHKLLDYMPGTDGIETVTVTDLGDSFEISYTYTDRRAKELCQTVLTSVIDDEHGIAVNYEEDAVTEAGGTLRVSKDTCTLLSHKIRVSALFEDGESSYKTTLEHDLKMNKVK